MTVEEARANIGRRVIYWDRGRVETGVIVDASSLYVFVRYGDDVGTKATPPELLALEVT